MRVYFDKVTQTWGDFEDLIIFDADASTVETLQELSDTGRLGELIP